MRITFTDGRAAEAKTLPTDEEQNRLVALLAATSNRVRRAQQTVATLQEARAGVDAARNPEAVRKIDEALAEAESSFLPALLAAKLEMAVLVSRHLDWNGIAAPDMKRTENLGLLMEAAAQLSAAGTLSEESRRFATTSPGQS